MESFQPPTCYADQWLTELAWDISTIFERIGLDSVPGKLLVTPSHTESWDCEAYDKSYTVNDALSWVFISAYLDDPYRIAEVLTHGLIHVIVGNKHGHTGPFQWYARRLGLLSPYPQSRAGQWLRRELTEIVDDLIDDLGPYPFSPLIAWSRRQIGDCPIRRRKTSGELIHKYSDFWATLIPAMDATD